MAAPYPTSLNELTARVVTLEAALVALRQVLDERDERYKLRASSQDDAVKIAMDAADKALVKAEAATEKRLEGLNELRNMANDQANKLLPRAEYNVNQEGLTERVRIIENSLREIQGRGGGIKEVWGYIIALAAIFVAGFVEYFRH